MPKVRLLLCGLDGATFKVLRKWLEADELPFISELYKDGAHGPLKTFFPTFSPMEWACFYTGKNPGKLGIFALRVNWFINGFYVLS